MYFIKIVNSFLDIIIDIVMNANSVFTIDNNDVSISCFVDIVLEDAMYVASIATLSFMIFLH